MHRSPERMTPSKFFGCKLLHTYRYQRGHVIHCNVLLLDEIPLQVLDELLLLYVRVPQFLPLP